MAQNPNTDKDVNMMTTICKKYLIYLPKKETTRDDEMM